MSRLGRVVDAKGANTWPLGGAEDLYDIRSISYVGSLYKLLAKGLAMKKVVGEIVSSKQNVFFEGLTKVEFWGPIVLAKEHFLEVSRGSCFLHKLLQVFMGYFLIDENIYG